MNVWKLEEDTAMERIRKHYVSGYELSAHDEEVKCRWQAAFTFYLGKVGSDKQISAMLMKTFNISETQAYRDIVNARMLFGDLREATKKGLRYVVTQWSIDYLQMAFIKKDLEVCMTKGVVDLNILEKRKMSQIPSQLHLDAILQIKEFKTKLVF